MTKPVPEALPGTDDPEALVRRGWALYGSGEWNQAAEQARQASTLTPTDPEPSYLLGMALKAAGDRQGATKAFQRAALDAARLSDTGRATMLRRLAIGQANWLDKGEWDLEPETWVRT